jgi:hypothetical protein
MERAVMRKLHQPELRKKTRLLLFFSRSIDLPIPLLNFKNFITCVAMANVIALSLLAAARQRGNLCC